MTLEQLDQEGKMPERQPWLTPQFGFQLLTWFAATLITLGAFAWSIKGDVRSLAEEQGRQGHAIEEMRKSLPNGGEMDQKLERLADRIERLERYDEKAEARWDNVNTRLSRKGM